MTTCLTVGFYQSSEDANIHIQDIFKHQLVKVIYQREPADCFNLHFVSGAGFSASFCSARLNEAGESSESLSVLLK